MPNKLVDISIKEVSGVDTPANMRKFLIVKRAAPGNTLKEKLLNVVKRYLPVKAEGAMTFTQALASEVLEDKLADIMYEAQYALQEAIKSIVEDITVTDKITAIRDALNEFSQIMLATFQQAFGAVGAATTPGTEGADASMDSTDMMNMMSMMLTKNQDKEGVGMSAKISEEVLKNLPEDVKKYLQELEAKVAKTAELEKKVAELEKKAAPEEDILKGLPEPVRKMVEEANQRAKQAEELAKAERESRLRKEYIAKAAELTGLAVKPEEFGPVLKAVAEACPNEYAQIEAVLKAANTAIEKSNLFNSIGKGGEGAGTAWEEIQKKAAEVRKSEPTLTQEAAIAKVLREDQELYKRYTTELKGY